jgi:formylglycine-generating enzyme required for sulfatase activity
MMMVYVPGGEFIYGAANAIVGFPEERPQRRITLSSFWIDQTEVTNHMYSLCVQAGACKPPLFIKSYSRPAYYNNPAYADYPVIYVSWFDASAYCSWAGRRLPTEAEWEKAARGDDGRIYPWDDERVDCRRANFWEYQKLFSAPSPVGCSQDTQPVGSYADGASPYGALDMVGNVREWVADWYDENYYNTMPSINPTGPSDGKYRVIRGAFGFIQQKVKDEKIIRRYAGGFFSFQSVSGPTSGTHSGFGNYAVRSNPSGAFEFIFVLRTTLRYMAVPNLADYNLGFRCAKTP